MNTKQMLLIVLLVTLNASLFAQSRPNSKILIKDVHIFNGKENRIIQGNILIKGQLIKTIS